jgi:hypothetical protein
MRDAIRQGSKDVVAAKLYFIAVKNALPHVGLLTRSLVVRQQRQLLQQSRT